MSNSKLSRRKALLLIAGVSASVVSVPVRAQKKRPRKRYRYKNRDDDDDNSTPSPTPSPSPTPAQPEKYSPPHPALIPAVGGGMVGLFGFVGAWFWKMNHKESEKESKKSDTSSRSVRNKIVDPIEQELNQMKFESGMTRVKSAKRATATASEILEWYVFRSGQAEGPYTKLQLLEVQKITDRTKVRLGESEWQRAGEIPELAAYLTQK